MPQRHNVVNFFIMKTVEFLNLLREFPNKTIRFAYAPSQFVKQGYHITEVKHLTIDTVDCGGRSHFWKETIIQLWEDPSNTDTSYMSAFKALSILKKVAKTKPFVQEATLKFEYFLLLILMSLKFFYQI